MKRISALLLILILLCGLIFGGCIREDDPVPTPPAQTTVPPETTLPPENEDVIGSFVIEDDVIWLCNSLQNMAGIVTGDSDPDYEQAHFDASRQALGIFPQTGKITFSFIGELPQKVTCYVDDYKGLLSAKEYTIDKPTAETVLYIEPLERSFASSILPSTIRRVSILCQYPDRTVEYFLVLEGYLYVVNP